MGPASIVRAGFPPGTLAAAIPTPHRLHVVSDGTPAEGGPATGRSATSSDAARTYLLCPEAEADVAAWETALAAVINAQRLARGLPIIRR